MQPTTPEQRAVLTARNMVVDFGAELLDDSDQWVEDLTADLVDGEVKHINTADVHGACTVQLLRELDWSARPRVRLWQSIATAATATPDRYNLGVFVLTTPEHALGESPTTYTVQGLDKLTLLQHAVGDTYVVAAGTRYLDAVRQVITDSGYTGLAPLLSSAAYAKLLDEPMVWLLDTSSPVTWVKVVNDLLAKIGYTPLWADQDGRFRADPLVAADVRAIEWTYDLTDPRTGIVGEDRTRTVDQHDATNWWRFIREGMTTRPTEGDGIYTVDRTNGGPRRPAVQTVQAADQEALVANGDQIVATATQSTETLHCTTGPLPILGHMDVAYYVDPELGGRRVVTQEHTIPLNGDDVDLLLAVV